MKGMHIALTALLLAGGCAARPAWTPPPVSRFIEYSLDEYDVVETDEVAGVGAHWWTFRYEIHPVNRGRVNRDIMVRRISYGLMSHGWKLLQRQPRSYTLSKIFETAPDDLHFTHGPFPGERPTAFHHQHIHVAHGAEVIVCYFESKL